MKTSFLLSALILISMSQMWAQDNRRARTNTLPMIGVTAPSFKAQSTNGEINFPGDFGQNWKILFAHPKDFTPVCSSELLELAYHQESFNRLGVDLVVISTDILSHHFDWKSALEAVQFKDREAVKISYPLVSDDSYKVSNLYGMIHPEVSIGENIRGVFIIDPDNKVRSIHYYPNEVGRNIDEIKRTLIALQTTHKNKNVLAPANWQPGEDLMVPVLSSAEKAKLGSPDSPFYQLSWFMTYKKNNQ